MFRLVRLAHMLRASCGCTANPDAFSKIGGRRSRPTRLHGYLATSPPATELRGGNSLRVRLRRGG